MLAFLFRKTASVAMLLLFVAMIAFALVYAAGDPAVRMVGEGGSAADAIRIRQLYRLDEPLPQQFLSWLMNVLQGDFGQSLYFNRPVTEIIGDRFQVTLLVGLAAILLALVVSIPLGVLAACFRGQLIDKFALGFTAIGQAVPTFWFALFMIVVFSIELQFLPPTVNDSWQSYIMPVLTVALFASPALVRLTRAGMIGALRADYTRTARAMSLPTGQIILKYCLRNALIPVVSVASAQFGHTLAGSIIIENIFAINGAGQLAWQSIMRADLPMVLALIMYFAMIYAVLTLLADMLIYALEPQMRRAT